MPILTGIVCAASLLAVLVRPWRIPGWSWVAGAAIALTASGLVRLGDAWLAVCRGSDVYLFLAGMMALAEIARTLGIFDWLAVQALRAAQGSQERLYALVFGVGVVVTVFLSNDATAVVLTPAIASVAERAQVGRLPYLFACAFVANAASFVLPISNPANLVVYAEHLPRLHSWLAAYWFPSSVSIVVTYATLRWLGRRSLRTRFVVEEDGTAELGPAGIAGVIALSAAIAGMVAANLLGARVGLATFVLALLATIAVSFAERTVPREVARGVTWSILPFVAGLFVIVQALDSSGALAAAQRFLSFAGTLPWPAGGIFTAVVAAGVSNLANNLTVAAIGGLALHGSAVGSHVVHASLVGIDLGPNLSVGGSLATLLWLDAVRRSGVRMTALRFARVGVVVLLPALLLSVLSLR